MANDLSARPWFLDTASATPVYKSQVFIKFVEWWDGGGAAGDLMEITDQNGKSIVKTQAQVAGDVQTFNCENWFNGLVLKTLASGNLRVHVK
jgi:hypothetical protein